MRAFSGQRLRQARLAAGLTPTQLALRVGRSVFTVIAYERGDSNPSAPVLGALADALSCAVDEFFTPAPAPEPVAATAATRGHHA